MRNIGGAETPNCNREFDPKRRQTSRVDGHFTKFSKRDQDGVLATDPALFDDTGKEETVPLSCLKGERRTPGPGARHEPIECTASQPFAFLSAFKDSS